MFCFKVSLDEAIAMWEKLPRSRNFVDLYVPWCVWLSRKGHKPENYLYATMHHWDEFIAFLTRKKLEGVSL